MAGPSDFELKQGDTSIRSFILRNPDDSRFDLTGYVVGDLAFFFELESVTPVGSAPSTGVGTFVITDAANGEITYQFAAADTSTVGVFRGEIEALLVALRNTFPQDGFFQFEVFADLGDQ